MPYCVGKQDINQGFNRAALAKSLGSLDGYYHTAVYMVQ